MPVPLSAYRTQGAVKYWDEFAFGCAHVWSVLSSTYPRLRTSVVLTVLSSTEGTTVPWRLPYDSIYIVPLLCSAYSTHGAVKYLGEYDSTLEPTVLLYSTYSTHGAVKYWEYDSTLEATVQYYVVLYPTYCTHVAAKYWEYHSTLVTTLQQYYYYCSTLHSSTVNTALSALHFTGGLFLVIVLVVSFLMLLLSRLQSHIFFLCCSC